MKLIVCQRCHDTVALGPNTRRCLCEKSSGRYYRDGITAEISGPCSVFGIHSGDIAMWIRRNQDGQFPKIYEGNIRAWAMPKDNPNIRRK